VGTTQQTDLDADRLKAARRNAGLTQADLAKRIGVSQARISSWEQGERHPDAFRLHGLAKALELDVLDLLPKGAPVTLRVLRLRVGLNQAELAQRLGMPRSTWSAIERGELAVPTDDIGRLAKLLGVDAARVVAAGAGGAEAEVIDLPQDIAEELDAIRDADETMGDVLRRVVRRGLSTTD
jgi:transcriptional regulator with XRE-family HTH domain